MAALMKFTDSTMNFWLFCLLFCVIAGSCGAFNRIACKIGQQFINREPKKIFRRAYLDL